MEPWYARVEAEGSVVIGSTLVTLSKAGCYYRECTLGNFVTDAFVFAVSGESNLLIVIIRVVGIRSVQALTHHHRIDVSNAGGRLAPQNSE